MSFLIFLFFSRRFFSEIPSFKYSFFFFSFRVKKRYIFLIRFRYQYLKLCFISYIYYIYMILILSTNYKLNNREMCKQIISDESYVNCVEKHLSMTQQQITVNLCVVTRCSHIICSPLYSKYSRSLITLNDHFFQYNFNCKKTISNITILHYLMNAGHCPLRISFSLLFLTYFLLSSLFYFWLFFLFPFM